MLQKILSTTVIKKDTFPRSAAKTAEGNRGPLFAQYMKFAFDNDAQFFKPDDGARFDSQSCFRRYDQCFSHQIGTAGCGQNSLPDLMESWTWCCRSLASTSDGSWSR